METGLERARSRRSIPKGLNAVLAEKIAIGIVNAEILAQDILIVGFHESSKVAKRNICHVKMLRT